MAKALGAEVALFFTQGWPDGFYVDDWEIDPDPAEKAYQMDEKVDLSRLGVLIPEGAGDPENSMSFSTAFARWKKSRDFAVITVKVPRADEQEFRSLLSGRRYKVTG